MGHILTIYIYQNTLVPTTGYPRLSSEQSEIQPHTGQTSFAAGRPKFS